MVVQPTLAYCVPPALITTRYLLVASRSYPIRSAKKNKKKQNVQSYTRVPHHKITKRKKNISFKFFKLNFQNSGI